VEVKIHKKVKFQEQNIGLLHASLYEDKKQVNILIFHYC